MARGKTFAAAMAVLACLLLALPACHAGIMAVDLGAEFLKVALVQPGRTPISIVINEISKRKTPAIVGFSGQDRLVGEEAAGLTARSPHAVTANLRDLLGRPSDHPALQALASGGHVLPSLAAAGNRSSSSPLLQFEGGASLTAEEAVASLLEYAAGIAGAAAGDGAPPRDVVLVVPSYFGPAARQALLDAASAARLGVLGLVSPVAAAALQYGIDRAGGFAAEGAAPQHVLFYDLGAGGLEAGLVRYSSYKTRTVRRRRRWLFWLLFGRVREGGGGLRVCVPVL